MQHPHPSGMAATPSSSTLARLQQLIVFATVGLVAGWMAWSWGRPGWAVAVGGVLLLFGYALVLGLEFFAVAHVNRHDPAPQATARTLVKAWWREVQAAPRVFSWRQPFRWWCLPDDHAAGATGQPAVVFVHGFVCNRGFWLPWMQKAALARTAVHQRQPGAGLWVDRRLHPADRRGRAARPCADRRGACAGVPQHGRAGGARLARRDARRRQLGAPHRHHRFAAPRHLAGAVQPLAERAADAAGRPLVAGAAAAARSCAGPRAPTRRSPAGTPVPTTSCSPPRRPHCPGPTTASSTASRMSPWPSRTR